MSTETKRLKVAILCKGYHFDRWEAEAIREVMRLPFVTIVLLIAEDTPPSSSKGFFHKLIHYPYRHFLWRYYKRFRLKCEAYGRVDLQEDLLNIPMIHCRVELKGKYSEHFTSTDLDLIRKKEPDVILRFAYNILRGEILDLAKYGVWSFHHADEQKIRGGPAAFWEIAQGHAGTSAILQRLTEKLDAGIILRKGTFQTISRSYKNNLDQLLMGTTSWMKQALLDVHHNISRAVNGVPVVTNAKVYSFPGNLKMMRVWCITKSSKIKFHFKELFKAQKWTIGIVTQSANTVLEHGLTGSINWLKEKPRGKYIADPFGWVNEKNELQIVAEEYHYQSARGFISCVHGNKKQGILAMPFHLSYPFVIEHHGIHLLPESYEANKLRMYDLEGKGSTVLLDDFPAVDATPVFFEGKWWLFCTKAGAMSNTELHIFHSTSLEGKWQPHANNPVKCDIGSARPGGTPFVYKEKLFRPSQDCSRSYGCAVILNEVITLTQHTFAEVEVKRISPHSEWKFNKGLHTLSIVNNDTILIDAKRYEFNLYNFKRKLGMKISRFFQS